MTTLTVIKSAEQLLNNNETPSVQLFHALEACEREYNNVQEGLLKQRVKNEEEQRKVQNKIEHLKAQLAGLQEQNTIKQHLLEEHKILHTYERQNTLNQVHRVMYDHQSHFAAEHDVLASRITGLSAALSSLHPVHESQQTIIAHWKKLLDTINKSEENWRKAVETVMVEMELDRQRLLQRIEVSLKTEQSKLKMELIKELHAEFAEMQLIEAKQYEEYREVHQQCAKATEENERLKKALKTSRWTREINQETAELQKTHLKRRENMEKRWTEENLAIGSTL